MSHSFQVLAGRGVKSSLGPPDEGFRDSCRLKGPTVLWQPNKQTTGATDNGTDCVVGCPGDRPKRPMEASGQNHANTRLEVEASE